VYSVQRGGPCTAPLSVLALAVLEKVYGVCVLLLRRLPPDQCRAQGDHLHQRRHREQQPGAEGVANFYREKKRHIVTSQTEHKCVLDSARWSAIRINCCWAVVPHEMT